jgi:hypothetical protein
MAVSWLKRGGGRMFDRWKGLWRKPQVAAPLPKNIRPMPFRVACRCGYVLEGMRQLRRQILVCPKCGRKVFVLPASPWPRQKQESDPITPVAGVIAAPQVDPAATGQRTKVWRQPLRAGIITLLLMGLLVLAVFLHLDSSGHRSRSQSIRDHAEAGRKALDTGSLGEAFTELARASEELQRLPRNFPHKDAAAIQRLHRQVALVHTLLTQSLEELVAEAKQAPLDEWNARFAGNYAHKAVVFDAYLFPDHKEHVRLDYVVEVEGTGVRVELNDIDELETWVSPNQEGQRWIFGLRLADIKLNNTPAHPEGLWTIYFQKESIELITEPALLRFLDLSDQRELRAVMDRQKRLVAWQPAEPKSPEGVPPGTPGELVRRMRGPPARIARQILAGRHLEQWVYEQPQPLRLRLEHRRGGQSTVTQGEERLPIPQQYWFLLNQLLRATS